MAILLWIYVVGCVTFWAGLFMSSDTTGLGPILTRFTFALLWPVVLLYRAAFNVGCSLEVVQKRHEASDPSPLLKPKEQRN